MTLSVYVYALIAAGNGVPRTIHRVSIGPLQLGDLALGQWRHLTEEELSALQLAVNPPNAQVLTHSFI